jgi:ABC-type dipeptide/oligopeptide/nickel transport system permease component
MARFIIVRLVQGFLTLLGVTFISFLIIKLSPTDPFAQLKLNPQVSPQTIELLKKQYGLDQPLLVQYLKWLKSALVFDLGISLQYNAPVLDLIKERIGNTLLLTVPSALLSWLLAVPLGFLAGMKEGSLTDKAIRLFSYVFMSFPSFFLAFLLLLFLSKSGFFQVGWMAKLGGGHSYTDFNILRGAYKAHEKCGHRGFKLSHGATSQVKRAQGLGFYKAYLKECYEPFYYADRLRDSGASFGCCAGGDHRGLAWAWLFDA